MWNKFPDVMPPDNPNTENFGVEYEVKYILPNRKIENTITEWLWTNEWNLIYPVIEWKEYRKILPFNNPNKH